MKKHAEISWRKSEFFLCLMLTLTVQWCKMAKKIGHLLKNDGCYEIIAGNSVGKVCFPVEFLGLI